MAVSELQRLQRRLDLVRKAIEDHLEDGGLLEFDQEGRSARFETLENLERMEKDLERRIARLQTGSDGNKRGSIRRVIPLG